jgi:hypothetical protein
MADPHCRERFASFNFTKPTIAIRVIARLDPSNRRVALGHDKSGGQATESDSDVVRQCIFWKIWPFIFKLSTLPDHLLWKILLPAKPMGVLRERYR